ncbi:MAG: hypothetical protein WA317_01165, partial [Mycobacterium sp.]
VTTTPLTTTSTLTTTQPLAYSRPEPPGPPVPPSAPQPPLLNPGDTAQSLTPPPPASKVLAPPPPAPQPATAPGGPPEPSLGSGSPEGSGGPGAQMLGTGPGGTPQAPPTPIPLDPAPPQTPIAEMTPEEAIAAWNAVNADINAWNARCGRTFAIPTEQAAYDACIADKGPLLERQAAIRARLGDLGIRIEGEEPAQHPEKAEPPFPPPQQINGFTDHGRERVEDRDGHGVNDDALQDAVEHPVSPPSYQIDSQGRGSYSYEGKDAIVVLNKDGQVVTAWARAHQGWRH